MHRPNTQTARRYGTPWKKPSVERTPSLHSFDIALQNEFSLEENIALARQFLLENFVSRGMVVDFAVHQPDREDGGIPNPHFHVLCPIRPIEQNGKWGCKQHRVYELDEDGNRIRDADGNFVFNAVPTDWGSPETLEYWRQTWAELCNAKFAEKELDVRIDHRSYERQGVELLPTVHEGATVRAMEKKAYAPKRASSTAGSRQPMPLSGTSRRKSLSCSIGLPKQKQSLPSRRPRPCFSAERLLHPAQSRGVFAERQGQQSKGDERDFQLSPGKRHLLP